MELWLEEAAQDEHHAASSIRGESVT